MKVAEIEIEIEIEIEMDAVDAVDVVQSFHDDVLSVLLLLSHAHAHNVHHRTAAAAAADDDNAAVVAAAVVVVDNWQHE